MSRSQPSEEDTLAPVPSDEPTLAPVVPAGEGRETAEPSEDALLRALRTLGGASKVETAAKRRYAFEDLLGRGGMGEVWRVDDLHLERDVALKRMRKQGAKPEELARFLREAQLSGSLEHPNIVPIYDLGVDDEGDLFFTMKRLRGRSLHELLEAGELGSLHERLTIFRKVCDAMAFAHAREVIHRDLKPDNVMIGEFGEVMVLDWGLAKRLGERDTALCIEDSRREREPAASAQGEQDSSENALTVAGSLMGTPAFMAPEQALGHHHLVDTRTDIYALGILLYVLLTGERPFRGSVAAVLFQVSRGVFDAPSVRASVPRELEAIVLRAMTLEHEGRYASVTALSADIQAYVEGRPVSVIDYSSLERLRKWAGRNRATVAGVVTTGALGLVALFVGGLVYLSEVEHARDRAERARDEAEQARDEARNNLARARAAEREAQLRESDAEVGLALALAQGGDYLDAVEHLDAARAGFERVGGSTFAVDFVHAWVDGENPPPVASHALPEGARLVSVGAEGERIVWQQKDRVGVEDWLRGERVVERQVPGLHEHGVVARGADFITLARKGGETGELGEEEWPVEARLLLADTQLSMLPGGRAHRLCGDGEHVLIEDVSGHGQRWSLSTGEPRGARFGCGQVLSTSEDCGRVLCNAERLATHQRSARTDVWDGVGGRKLHELPASNTHGISPDGTLMLASHEHGGVELWDLERGVSLWRDTEPERTGSGLFSADGQHIYAQGPDRRLQEWTREGEWLGERHLDGMVRGGVDFPYLLTSDRGELSVWSKGGGAHEIVRPDAEQLWAADWGAGELVTMSVGVPNLVYDPHTGASLFEFGHGSEGGEARCDLDEQGHAVVATLRGELSRYEFPLSSRERGRLNVALDEDVRLTTVRMLPGGEAALIGDSEGALHVWDFAENAIVARHETGQFAWALDVDPSGKRAYVAGRIGSQTPLTVVDLDSGEQVFSSPAKSAGYSVSVGQRDAQTVFAVGTHRGVVEVWTEDHGEPLARLAEVRVPIMGLGFSPDGELLAASTYTRELLLWRTRDWHAYPTLPVALPGLGFSNDGRRLLALDRSFDFELSSRSEAARLGLPGPEESPAQRLHRAIGGLALQRDWAGADALIRVARREGGSVDELLAGRIAWKFGDSARALAAFERVDPTTLAVPAELEIWLRVTREASEGPEAAVPE